MLIKGLIDEEFLQYKEPSMFIIMPFCDFKCEAELGIPGLCQNSPLANTKTITVDADTIINRYMQNNITKAIVFGGLEPMLSQTDLEYFISKFREVCGDTIVIYTGYTEREVKDRFNFIYNYNNIIVKFGRYIPNEIAHYDEVLGVDLASNNQYAKKIS